MAPSFLAYPSVPVVRQADFAASSRIHEIFGAVIHRDLKDGMPALTCSVSAQTLTGGIRLTFDTTFTGLTEQATVTHKFFFVDRDETRERIHLLDPAAGRARTELLVMFPDGIERDYCHASVYDAQGRLLAVYAVVFDRDGRVVHYPFTERYVSPLELASARLTETRSASGSRVLRFSLALRNLTTPESVVIAWEAIGLTHRRELVCHPDHPEVFADLELDDNPTLAPGDWVAIAVDEKDRVLAQAIVTLVPARAVTPAWPA